MARNTTILATVIREKEWLKIFIDGVLHFSIVFADIDSVQAFIKDGAWDRYRIEWSRTGKPSLLTGYADKERWKQILKQINNFL